MKLKLKLESIVLLLTVIFLSVGILLYIYMSPTKTIELGTFLSSIATVGILILTAFYVIYTNRQIRELQKQRQLQIQPLPSIEILDAGILSPRLVHSLKENKVKLVIDLPLKIRIKNIGNGTATLVDLFAYFKGKDIAKKPEMFYPVRFLVLEEGRSESIDEFVRDEYFEVVKSLNKGVEGPCLADKSFDVLLSCHVVYRNILGAIFHLSLDHVLYVDSESKPKLTDWLSHITSFSSVFADESARFSAVCQRDKKEAIEFFDEIKDSFYKRCPPDMIIINIAPIPQSFFIKILERDDFDILLKKVWHGIPLGVYRADEKAKEKSEKWRGAIVRSSFFFDFNEHHELELEGNEATNQRLQK